MSTSVEARCLVYDFVTDLANVEPDPTNWAPYLKVLLKRLEDEADKLDRIEAFKGTYAALCEDLSEQLKSAI